MKNAILQIFKFFNKRKTLLLCFFILTIGFLIFSILKINFAEDISTFLPKDAKNERINEAYKRIALNNNKIIVRISPKSDKADEERLIEGANRFVEILQQNDSSKNLKEMFLQVDMQQVAKTTDFILDNLPFYLDQDDYKSIDTLINSKNIERQLLADKKILLSPMGIFMQNIIKKDPLMFSKNILREIEIFNNSNYNTDNGYIFNDKGECIVVVTSKHAVSETSKNKQLIDAIYKAAKHTMEEMYDGDIKIIPFGATIISVENADRIKKDSVIAVIISSILIFSLLFFFFRSLKPLFFIVLAITFGALFSLGLIVVLKSTVSIIAIGIASIIFGIAINYPLHFLTHFKHTKNIERSLKDLINPMLIGNITTVGAFISLLFISSEAMHDLGLFSALLLVGTIVFVMIFMPHLLGGKIQKNRYANDDLSIKTSKRNILQKIVAFSPENHKTIVTLFLILTIILLFFSFNTKFDVNMQSINYMTEEQKKELKKLIEETGDNNQKLYLVAEGKTADEALDNYYTHFYSFLKNKDRATTIEHISGIGRFFPTKSFQKTQIDKWNLFWEKHRDELFKNFKNISIKNGFKADVFDDFKKILKKEYDIKEFDYFYQNMGHLAENYVSIDSSKTMILTILQDKNINKIKAGIVDSENTFSFSDNSFMQKLIVALSDDFNKVLYICGFIVFVFLLFSFGRIEIALIAFIPLAVGWIWILGTMNIFDIRFNIVNVILATFIFGQGDDYTIFVTEGLIYEYTYGKKILDKFKTSIFMSATILFIAVGILVFAKHPAMKSLAEVTIIGMISVVICAYMLPPLIYKWLIYKKGEKRLMPITLWNLIKTTFSFIVFVFSAILMTIIGFFILTIGGKSNQNKELFHSILCRCFRLMAKLLPQIGYDIENEYFQKFKTPSVIIANHQSHLDLLYILLLTPKIVALTNNWVWKNPFYGIIIRYADFIPVADGVDSNLDKIQTMVDRGYSILVFPEGHRSEDKEIGRFKKGAFYIAKKLNLDILPIIIHGTGDVLPKKEFILRKGQVKISIQKPIDISDKDNTLELRQTVKNIRKLYIETYKNISYQIENTEYFVDLVLKNYIYKGNKIAKNARRTIKKHENFKEIISKLPNNGNVLMKNCKQGEIALMSALVKKNLMLTAIDSDSENIDIAKNCISIPRNLNYKYHIDEILNFDKIIDCNEI